MAAGLRSAGLSGYVAVPFANFADGLNLKAKADAVKDSECIDCLNVQFLEVGAIDQRDGYTELTGSDLTNRVDSLAAFYKADGTRQLVAGCGTRLEALSTTGSVVASQTGLSGGPYSFARFAAPGSEFMYCANGTDTPQRWNGTSWASGAASATVNGAGGAAMPKAGALCVTATLPGNTSGTNAANRLVATAYGTAATSGPGGTTSTPSRVHFSNPGAPETWETDGTSGRGRNFLDLTPGDGEQIMNAVTWRELVIIFKETKFFVLWGEQPANDGTPVFNVREVVTGIGLAAKRAVCVGRDGVYFMARNGVYFTNGSDPVLVSENMDPMWRGNPDVYFESDAINLAQITNARMAWVDEQVFLAVPTGPSSVNNRVLVYDTDQRWWSLYDLPAAAMAGFRRADQTELHFGYSSGAKRVAGLRAGATDDNGTAITSRWRSGWFDYDSPAVKTIRESKIWGSGAARVRYSKDFEKTADATDTAVWGGSTTWPVSGTWSQWIASNNVVWPGGGQISVVLSRKAVRGTVFSTQFLTSELSAGWSVHRVTRHLREQRIQSIEHS